MKIPTPIITLIVGVALAASLLVSSMSAVSAKKAAQAQASASAAANSVPAASASSAQSASAGASAKTVSSPSASPSSTASGFVVPPHANYDGQVQGDLGSVAIVVHDTFAIAYFCNGKTQEAWFKGTPHNGQLSMTGTGTSAGATLTANYALGHARGTVTVDGISHVFSIIAVHKPSGLFQSIAVVRGASIKAGWIVLADGTQVGSMFPNVNAANPVSQTAPKLDVSSLTAQYEGTTITATPIDAETGTGF
jgi:serine/threonine protein kinase, bacterial